TAETNGVKGQADTKDTHIKSNSLANSPDQKIVAPQSKGGPQAKGPWGTCTIHIDNHTPYIIEFYFDGDLDGVMGPWGDLYPNVTRGVGQLYARAVFDDGTVLTYGPRD